MTIEGLQKHWEVIKDWHENPTREVERRPKTAQPAHWEVYNNHDFRIDFEYRLKPQIEAWAVVSEEGIPDTVWSEKSFADKRAHQIGGTVIRLVPEQEVK